MAKQGPDFNGPQVMAPPLDSAQPRALVAAPAMPPMMGMPGFAPRGPEILVGGFNQMWLTNCLRRRWLMAAALGLLIGGSVAGFLTWLFPVSSRITSYLEVKSQDDSATNSGNQRAVNTLMIEREAARHPALLKSPLVLEAALFSKGIAELDAVQYHKGEEVEWLRNDLKVNFSEKSPILELSYVGEESSEDMKKIVDAVVRSYKDNVLMQERLTALTTQDDLTRVFGTIRGELQRKIEDLKTKMEATGRGDFDNVRLPKLRQDIVMYQTQLLQVERDLADAEVMKQIAIQQAQSTGALEAAVSAEMDKDPTISMYKEQLFVLDQQIQQLQASSKNPGNSQLTRLRGQYQQTETMMAQYRIKAEGEARERLSKIPNEGLRAAMTEYNVRFEYLSNKQKELKKQLLDAEKEIEEGSIPDPEMEMLEQEIESQRELVNDLNLQIMHVNAENRRRESGVARRPGEDSDYDSVKVVQKALATEQINKYELWAIAGIGGTAALALTCYGVALVEFRRRRLNGAGDMDDGLGVRVLGVLPPTSLKALAGNSLTATQVAAAIDNVRATIMHDSTSRARQVVMVTSSATMEGSTTVAASLALSLARAGRRTLLVDGDLRSPSLHKLFGTPLEDGLSEVLRSEIDLSDAVRPTSTEGLHLLSAGICDMDAIHALATDQPQAIFEKLRDQFDFIVIDAPPVLGISDTLSLGQYIDGAILTVLRDHSEIRKVYAAIETLRTMGVRLIGSVVNGVPSKADRRMVRLHQASQNRTPRLTAKNTASKETDEIQDFE
jgi:succinoglycan biosynthesis transport protein ExoP